MRALPAASAALALVAGALGAAWHPGHLEAAPAGYPLALERYHEQRLDHFNLSDARRFRHRYFLNADMWDGRGQLANGCLGPVLLYTGNEGPIDAFWNVSGFIVETLAQRLGGLVLFSEQRYYGASLPFGDASFTAEHLAYLTTAQVVADHAEIVGHIKAMMPGARDCPVVAFGGSYGGTLTALLRAKYPSAIVGGLASSSEIGYYDVAGWEAHGVDTFTFEDVVVATYQAARPGCLGAIEATMAAIDAADTQRVVEAFGVCDVRALGPGKKSGFFAYVLEGLPQGNYRSAGEPVTAACDELLAAQGAGGGGDELLEAAGRVAVRSYGGAAACVEYDVGGPGNTPGDGPSPKPWGWQSCTETLHAFDAHVIRDYTFDLGKSTELCHGLYGRAVSPDMGALSNSFGGAYGLAEGATGVTQLIWSQGTQDPWHGWFRRMAPPPPHSDVHHIVIEGAAHHEDLRAPAANDRASVVAARAEEEAIIRRWVVEASGASEVTRFAVA